MKTLFIWLSFLCLSLEFIEPSSEEDTEEDIGITPKSKIKSAMSYKPNKIINFMGNIKGIIGTRTDHDTPESYRGDKSGDSIIFKGLIGKAVKKKADKIKNYMHDTDKKGLIGIKGKVQAKIEKRRDAKDEKKDKLAEDKVENYMSKIMGNMGGNGENQD